MNFFVTVGTTGYDQLFHACDRIDWSGNAVRYQIGPGKFHPVGGQCDRFIEDVLGAYSWADVVITHAGAGSVYTLLEMGKRIIVVPNLRRRDKHQRELARFVEMNKFGLVVWDMEGLADAVRTVDQFDVKPYNKYPFFLGNELSRRINSALGCEGPRPVASAKFSHLGSHR